LRTRDEVLAEANEELPTFDWRQGARDYLAHFFAKYTRAQIEDFAATKPIAAITPEDPVGALTEVVAYLNNFANTIGLLKLPRGARVLDVACGAGWVSHWMTKLGYRTLGVDISEDFIGLARARIAADPNLDIEAAELERMFVVRDLEREALNPEHHGQFDAIVLESCLHHFLDPISAMVHLVEALKDDGVVLILEGENRQGSINPDYMQVMVETHTLERPYPRRLLIEILEHAGLAHYEFMGAINGFVPDSAWLARYLTEELGKASRAANICVCATADGALRRVVPSYCQPPAEPEAAAPDTPDTPDTPEAQTPAAQARPIVALIRSHVPAWMLPPLRRLRRLFRQA
jgi:SAM-dependent methyltransferase